MTETTLTTPEDLVGRLAALGPGEIDSRTVAELIALAPLEVASFEPRVTFREDRYTRHSLWRSAWFEMLLVGWMPGQVSAVHDHSGQLGWVRVLRGTIEEETWDFVEGALRERGKQRIEAGPAVARVDDTHEIHRLRNADETERAVTLHVYSRPFDSCGVYDLETGRRHVCQLELDSVPGE